MAVQDDFELEENDADLVAQGTPHHWRMRAHALGNGAFHALKVPAEIAFDCFHVNHCQLCAGKNQPLHLGLH